MLNVDIFQLFHLISKYILYLFISTVVLNYTILRFLEEGAGIWNVDERNAIIAKYEKAHLKYKLKKTMSTRKGTVA